MVMGALARQGKHQTTTMEQMMVGPLFDHVYSHIRKCLPTFTLEDPNAIVLNQLWTMTYQGISLSTSDGSPAFQVVRYFLYSIISCIYNHLLL